MGRGNSRDWRVERLWGKALLALGHGMLAHFRSVLSDTTPGLRPKVIGLYSVLITSTLVVWGLTILTTIRFPFLLPAALLAYSFGLRHAVDADHISAIDNVTRKLMHERKMPVTVGFYFSMGHSTVVFILAALVAAGSTVISNNLANDHSGLKFWGGLIGTSIAALFLFAIAIMNMIVLVQIIQTFRNVTKGNAYDEQDIEDYLNKRGFYVRIFRPLFKSIDKSWKMYPVGFVFGLGFETATEITLLAISGSFTAQHVPFFVVLLLPLLFTAGMSIVDTTDGVLMLGAYSWAFVKPIRKLFYNVSITAISVLVALLVGTIETLGIVAGQLRLPGGFWDVINHANDQLGLLGVAIVGICILSWTISTILYKAKKYDKLETIRANVSPAADD
jgi:nickel/cobalt transporter (NiCoT) family protein